MPIYDITVEPSHPVGESYRINADNLEDAKDAAINLFIEQYASEINQCVPEINYEAYGEESDDQDSEADFSTKDVD